MKTDADTHQDKRVLHRIWVLIKPLISVPESSRKDNLQLWRERILLTVLGTSVVLALPVYIVSVTLTFKAELWQMAVLITFCYLAILCLFFMRQLKYEIRAGTTVFIGYAIGVGVTLSFGFLSGGPAWLFAFAVLTGLLVGLKAAVVALMANAMTLFLLGMLSLNGPLSHLNLIAISVDRLAIAGINFIFLNAATALSAAVLVHALQSSAEKEKAASRILAREREQLIEAKERLKDEIEVRKQTEKSLRLFEFAIDHSSDAVYWIRPDTRIFYTNRAALRTLNYTREEILGMKIEDVDPSFRSEVWPRYWRLLQRRGSTILESKQRKKDGHIFPVEISINYLEYGGEEYCCAFARDITERKNAERALKESEEKYRLLAENINDVIWTMTLGFRFTYVSPAIERMQGWSVEEAYALQIEDILTPASLQKVNRIMNDQLRQAERTGDYQRSAIFELEMICKDGHTIWTEVTASFVLGENRLPVGILGVSRDISDRKAAQREKEELQEKLARSKKMEALGLLAGGVAHDLNNVLSGIVSYPDLLLMDLPKESPMRSPILTIKESGQKAATIVQDLLTLARRGVATTEVLNLNTIVTQYLDSPELAGLRDFHQGLEIETRLESHLPNINGSSVHLKKTIMNLVSNAAESQLQGGKIVITTYSIYLDASRQGFERIDPGEYAVLRVEDSGEGIAAEDLPRIFEPFYTKKVMGRSGTGLGMAVVWGTVHDHKGFLDVDSVEGRGTCFDLYFPITRESMIPEDVVRSLDEYRGNLESILIVDDIEDQRKIVSEMLSKLNYTVDAVASGEEAVNYVKNNRVDLIILDMIMDPGMDGLETYKRILETSPVQKAIIASGYSETDRVQEAQRLGAGKYIKKPYTIEKIGQAIKDELMR
jgi:PAS domain S-box-containing protein